MKKLLFMAMLGITGVAYANDAKKESVLDQEKTESSTRENLNSIKPLPSQWIECTAQPCGITYYMQLSSYNTLDEFWDANEYFNSVKCD